MSHTGTQHIFSKNHLLFRSYNSYQNITEQLAVIATYIAIAGVPFSHTLIIKFSLLAFIFSALSGAWLNNLNLFKEWYFRIIIALLLLLLVSFTYTIASLHEALSSFFHYTKLLYIPFLIPLFLHNKRQITAQNILIISLFASMIFATLHFYSIINLVPFIDKHKWIFTGNIFNGILIHPLGFSVLTALSTFILIIRCIKGEKRLLNITLIIFFTWFLYHVCQERTGGILLPVLLIWFFSTQYSFKGLMITLCLCIPFAILIHSTSPTFSHKTEEMAINLVSNNPNNVNTSTGLRKAFIRHSMQIISESPLLGKGVGSFNKAFAQTHGPTFSDGTQVTDPHDSFLLVGIQVGILGICLYIAWIVALWLKAKQLQNLNKYYARALLIALIFNGCTNATLIDPIAGNFYVLFIAIFFATNYKASSTQNK